MPHVSKARTVMRTTIDNKEYKAAHKHTEDFSCSYCAPNKGCNRSYKHKKHPSQKPKYKNKRA